MALLAWGSALLLCSASHFSVCLNGALSRERESDDCHFNGANSARVLGPSRTCGATSLPCCCYILPQPLYKVFFFSSFSRTCLPSWLARAPRHVRAGAPTGRPRLRSGNQKKQNTYPLLRLVPEKIKIKTE